MKCKIDSDFVCGNLVNSLDYFSGIFNQEDADIIKNVITDACDWSFTIKTHALVEATTTHVLAVRLGESLHDVFSSMPLADNKKGRIAFLSKLGLIRKESIDFVRNLSALRNAITHEIRHININLNSTTNSEQIQRKINALKSGILSEAEGEIFRASRKNDVRLMITIRFLSLLSESYMSIHKGNIFGTLLTGLKIPYANEADTER